MSARSRTTIGRGEPFARVAKPNRTPPYFSPAVAVCSVFTIFDSIELFAKARLQMQLYVVDVCYYTVYLDWVCIVSFFISVLSTNVAWKVPGGRTYDAQPGYL